MYLFVSVLSALAESCLVFVFVCVSFQECPRNLLQLQFSWCPPRANGCARGMMPIPLSVAGLCPIKLWTPTLCVLCVGGGNGGGIVPLPPPVGNAKNGQKSNGECLRLRGSMRTGRGLSLPLTLLWSRRSHDGRPLRLLDHRSLRRCRRLRRGRSIVFCLLLMMLLVCPLFLR